MYVPIYKALYMYHLYTVGCMSVGIGIVCSTTQ